MAIMRTGAAPLSYCPKPNHIKPCWCKGVAECRHPTVQKHWCKRVVKGSVVHCWQHRKEGT